MTTTTATVWFRSRDKYGRSCHEAGNRIGVVTVLPKAAVERHNGCRYMATLWGVEHGDIDGQSWQDRAVTYHRSLKAAKAHLEQNRVR